MTQPSTANNPQAPIHNRTPTAQYHPRVPPHQAKGLCVSNKLGLSRCADQLLGIQQIWI
jgi:hypothetical protein